MIEKLLNQTITISSKSARSRYGTPTYSSPVTVKARIELTTKTIMNATKELVPIDAIVFVALGTTVVVEDKIIHGGINYRVMRKDVLVDGRGDTRHIELMAQKWL